MADEKEFPKQTVVRWDHNNEDDIAVLKWLKDKPKDYIIRRALKLYMIREEGLFAEVQPVVIPQTGVDAPKDTSSKAGETTKTDDVADELPF